MGRLDLEASFEATYHNKVVEVTVGNREYTGRVESVAVEGDALILMLNIFSRIVRVETHINNHNIIILDNGNNARGSDRDVFADF